MNTTSFNEFESKKPQGGSFRVPVSDVVEIGEVEGGSEVVENAKAEKTIDPEWEREVTEFVERDSQMLAKLFGLHGVSVRAGKEWSCNMTTGEVTVDPGFYFQRGLDVRGAKFSVCHEFAAHLRQVTRDPEVVQAQLQFVGRDKSKHIFNNIFTDIAGNKRIFENLPDMKTVAEEDYRENLFPGDNPSNPDKKPYAEYPRSLQFLYKIMREEMIPGSETAVLPEVDEMIAGFRNFQGSGVDLIEESTKLRRSNTEEVTDERRLKIWYEVIYPEWKKLLEADKEDPRFQKRHGNSQSGEGEDGDEGNDESGEQFDFSEFFDDYDENRNPRPMSDDERQRIERNIRDYVRGKTSGERRREREEHPDRQLANEVERQTGHSLREMQNYRQSVEEHQEEISELRGYFRRLLEEYIGVRRRLRGGHTEGATLTPERLAQTYIEIASQKPEVQAFSDYERGVSEHELTGKTDFVLAFDCSGSMYGEQARVAADSALICMEALAGMQRDIEEMQAEADVEVDVDIRTALYTFTEDFKVPKALGHGLSEKERLDAYFEIRNPDGGTEGAFLADISKLPDEPGRKRVLIVVTDGKIDGVGDNVQKLKAKGWRVFGIGIGTDSMISNLTTDGVTIQEVGQLPGELSGLIERNL